MNYNHIKDTVLPLFTTQFLDAYHPIDVISSNTGAGIDHLYKNMCNICDDTSIEGDTQYSHVVCEHKNANHLRYQTRLLVSKMNKGG